MNFRWADRALHRWISFVSRRYLWIIFVFVALSAAAGYLSVTRLGVNADFNQMLSDDLEFRQQWKKFRQRFPTSRGSFLLIIDAPSPEKVQEASNWFEEQVDKSEHLQSSSLLKGEAFFKKNALLYKKPQKLTALKEDFQKTQPLLKRFAAQPDLSGLLEGIQLLQKQTGKGVGLEEQLSEFFSGKRQELSPQALFFDQKQSFRHVLEILPQREADELAPATEAYQLLHKAMDLYRQKSPLTQLSLTGVASLQIEELVSVREGAIASAILTSFLVLLGLFWALRSAKLVGLTLLNLFIGLLLTTGFAAAVVQDLNMISVAFAVLFLGLGVDYSIHLSLRYRELLRLGYRPQDAVFTSMHQIGSSLVLCTLTTAAAFFAFVPTDYIGVSELGIISGVGMFVNFFVHLSLFPALLFAIPFSKRLTTTKDISIANQIALWSFRHSSLVKRASIGLLFVSLPFVFLLRFDSNPLRLHKPTAPAYQGFKQLVETRNPPPWMLHLQVENTQKLEDQKRKLNKLESVAEVVDLSSLLPEKQNEKLKILKNIQIPSLSNPSSKAMDLSAAHSSLLKFSKSLNTDSSSTVLLKQKLNHFLDEQSKNGKVSPKAAEKLQKALVEPMKEFLNQSHDYLPQKKITKNALPTAIQQHFVSSDGTLRADIHPAKNLMESNLLSKFVKEVTSTIDSATGAPLLITKSGRVIVEAFAQASFLAFFMIFFVLLVLTRRWSDSLRVFIPIFFSLSILSAILYLIGLPINFANIIVFPLLLGIGVDSSIHMIHRFRNNPENPEQVFEGSTSRGVFFSALTTIFSFASLLLSPHRGTAGMGLMLTLGTICIMLTSLILLPAFLRKHPRSSR